MNIRLGLVKTIERMIGKRSASWTASALGATGYNATNPQRKILQPGRRPSQATANELAAASLPALRNYSRQLERNNPTARAAVEGLVALVVGSGISLEPDTGDDEINDKIRKEWNAWISSCGADGRDIYQLESCGFRDVVCAGEMLWRLVMLPERKSAGQIPIAVLPLEPEWLDDATSGSIYTVNADGTVQLGAIKMDAYGRPLSYQIKNPEANSTFNAETVPASAIIHAFEKRRGMQARGEPWFAPVIETLQQERDLVDAELQAAVTSSSIGIAVTSQVHSSLTQESTDGTDPAQDLRIGAVARLYEGDEIESFQNTRPSQQIMPFRAGLRGDTAAALRVPQRFLDRNVGHATYMNIRADNVDTERIHGPIREWYGHATIGRCYREVLPFLAIRAGVPLPRSDYRLIPDAQPYVDPVKDGMAAKNAVDNNFSTNEYEIGKRGADYRQIREQRAAERLSEAIAEIERLKKIQAAVAKANEETPGLNLNWAQIATIGGASSAPVAYLSAATASQGSAAVQGDDGDSAHTRAPLTE
jgi:lambda family phage portal protein